MAKPGYTPMRLEDLAREIGADQVAYKRLRKIVPKLINSGALIVVKRDLLALPPQGDQLEGTILFRSSGSARVVFDRDDKGNARDPVHIQSEDTGVALHGDRVAIKMDPPRRREAGDWGTGRVTRIIKRAFTTAVGTLRRTRLAWYVIPDDPRIVREIVVRDPASSGLKPLPKVEDKVVLRLDPWERRNTNPTGTLIEVLGVTHTPMAEYKGILRQYRLEPEFPEIVEAAARAFPSKVPASDIKTREDFRKVPTITIDPDDAKDFDDALSVQTLPDGNIRIGIHIADVSHYVRIGTALDTEARSRGNSTYLVGTVIPMLPHALSSGLCSLVEGEDRLVKSVLVDFSPEGKILKSTFANAVICSRKRLTYKQALGFLKADSNAAIRAIPSPPAHQTGSPGKPLSEMSESDINLVRDMVRTLWRLADRMRKERFAAGSLDLDMMEVKMFVDKDGWADRTEIVVHDESHQLVEEFMLLANETVAEQLTKARIPHISRVHDEPDPEKLTMLRDSLAIANVRVGDLTKRSEMVKTLSILKDRDDGHILRVQLLRSLRQACYRPAADGHYGLAKRHYSHFTSPIRRYADLVEHRILDGWMTKHGIPSASLEIIRTPGIGDLAQTCDHISITERNSAEAERDSKKVKLLELFEREMERPDKRPFEARIMEVKAHGFMVELTASQAYGLVHMTTLNDDFYRMHPDGNALVGRRNGRVYAVGASLQVIVDKVDRFKRQVDFRVFEEAYKPTRGPERRKGGR
ncbi:MAG TPA: 3'-5' exonuclease, partial [Opitutae bacterium]|nr:3'-5' exonuclease [Opitutae bacterium]